MDQAVSLKTPPTRTNVIATASTTEKLDWLRSIPHGATHAINYKTQDFAEEVKAITGGTGVDVIIDVVGRTHWHKNIESLAIDGRMTLLAFLSGEIFFADGFCSSRLPRSCLTIVDLFAGSIDGTCPGAEVPSLNLLPILYKRLRIQGSTLRSRSADYQADLIARWVVAAH